MIYEVTYDRKPRPPRSRYYGKLWPPLPRLVTRGPQPGYSAIRWSRNRFWITVTNKHIFTINQDGIQPYTYTHTLSSTSTISYFLILVCHATDV